MDFSQLEADVSAWDSDLRRDDKGRILRVLANAITILGHDDAWQCAAPDGTPHHRIAWDAFSSRVVFVAPPPWCSDDAPGGARLGAVDTSEGDRARLAEPPPTLDHPRAWQDNDDARLAAWFARRWALDFNSPLAAEAARVVADRWPTHPVRAYLRPLEHDGTLRVDRWLADYLGADPTPYTLAVGRWWLISAVARVMIPGCKADHVLILEGAQGRRKSTALRTLVGDAWFSDTPAEIGDKDAFLAMRGRWVIELAELDALSRTEASKAKAFFSSPTDTYRPPYGRQTITTARQCVFAGTVNHGSYLRDETGARRFWPVEVARRGPIDLDRLAADRDQIWAEARDLFAQGSRWWPEHEHEHTAARAEQDTRYQGDEWEAKVASFASPFADSPNGVTVGAVLAGALDVPADRWTLADQRRVGACLGRLGLVRVQRRTAGVRSWCYVSPSVLEAARDLDASIAASPAES